MQDIEESRKLLNGIIQRLTPSELKLMNKSLMRQSDMYIHNDLENLKFFLSMRDKLSAIVSEMSSQTRIPRWKWMMNAMYIADYLQLYDRINAYRRD